MEIEEIVKELNLYERAILKIHKKMFNKVSNIIRVQIVNNILH